ncbi:pentapeptide repeat-containing protein [Thermopolyspora sp. NPDC052614]|uniref:pentapeptide repeat-containing protein n=1 Tax=Thermopolyspora sp. NPDC052614 TaxID=3155682 RepID=UPI003444C530
MILFSGALLWVALYPGARWLAGDLSGMDPPEKAEIINGARQTLIQSLGIFSLIIAAGAYVVNRRQQLTSRFNDGVSAMSSTEMVRRIGGINVLGEILRESPEQHNAVVSAITAFVRERTRSPAGAARAGRPDEDVVAAMTVLATRPARTEPEGILDLSATDLSGLRLAHAGLARANFRDARLINTDLSGADLQHALLDRTDLSEAILDGANLLRCSMRHTVLRDARLVATKLPRAVIIDADLCGATLHRADLTGAWLLNARLDATDVARTIMVDTWLRGDFRNVQNLSESQLLEARPVHDLRVGDGLAGHPQLVEHLGRHRMMVPPPEPF